MIGRYKDLVRNDSLYSNISKRYGVVQSAHSITRLIFPYPLDTAVQKLDQELHKYNSRKKGGEAKLPALFMVR